MNWALHWIEQAAVECLRDGPQERKKVTSWKYIHWATKICGKMTLAKMA